MQAAPPISPPPQQQVPSARLVDGAATGDQRTYALIMHVTLAAAALSIPPVIAPLIMWLIKREESPFINDHGKEAVNFQLSLVLYSVVFGLIGVVTCIGFIALPIIWGLGALGVVMAAMAANRGEYFRYPATIRFIT